MKDTTTTEKEHCTNNVQSYFNRQCNKMVTGINMTKTQEMKEC